MVPIPGCLGEQKVKENNERWKKEAFPKALKAFFFSKELYIFALSLCCLVSVYLFFGL